MREKVATTTRLEWGSLGERWGVNRSVSQIHAWLYASKEPMAAEQIADVLGIARSNVSNSSRELQSWNIIRSVPIWHVDPVVQLRLRELLDFVDRVSRWYDQTVCALFALGGAGLALLVDGVALIKTEASIRLAEGLGLPDSLDRDRFIA
jgi:hypothetical protein